MKTATILALLLVSTASGIALAEAEDADSPNIVEPFASLCKSKDEVGFSWENGHWVSARYGARDYIARKYDPKDFDTEALWKSPDFDPTFKFCDPRFKPEEYRDEGSLFWIVAGCYSFSEPGAPPEQIFKRWCTEEYYHGVPYLNASGWKLDVIKCPGLQAYFVPDGKFILRPNDVDIRDGKTLEAEAKTTERTFDDKPGGYKDSIVLGHGVCSKLE